MSEDGSPEVEGSSDDDSVYEAYDVEYPEDVSMSGSMPGPSLMEEDPEYFDYECLELVEVEKFLNEHVAALSEKVPVTPALAKVLLHNHHWKTEKVAEKYVDDYEKLLIDTKIKPPPQLTVAPKGSEVSTCTVCVVSDSSEPFESLTCGHLFCLKCWTMHFQTQLSQGVSTGIECMESACELLVPEDFVLRILNEPDLRAKYQLFVFQDHVKSHPQLRFCPGADCKTVIRARLPQAKRTTCKSCKHTFCFICGIDYHAPTRCATIKKWLMKCADDSETANYITAHTKDCPKCHICIEKNGGCNHMQCYKCKHHFCWMCLGEWKHHGSEYYECSRYKENPNIANEAVHVKAREALQKYLFYFERWENHNKSLKLEEQLFKRIKDRIETKINSKEGTWIDWQYLYDAAGLLTKCRYTLQYTYPFAYYLEPGPRKLLFEYQQGQLEAEIENLSWKVERAESTDRGELEHQMHAAEQKRKTLLRKFLDSDENENNCNFDDNYMMIIGPDDEMAGSLF